MPQYELDMVVELRRVVELLEHIERTLKAIERTLVTDLQQSPVTEVNGMSLPSGPVAPGASFTGTFTAVDAAGNTVPGLITFTSSDGSLLTATGDGSVSGVSVVTCDAIAAGSPVLTATFTNPDRSIVTTGTNDPVTIVIAAVVDLAVAVNGV
jgi:hypothetical protein